MSKLLVDRGYAPAEARRLGEPSGWSRRASGWCPLPVVRFRERPGSGSTSRLPFSPAGMQPRQRGPFEVDPSNSRTPGTFYEFLFHPQVTGLPQPASPS